MRKILLALIYTMLATIAFTGCGQGGETGSVASPVNGEFGLYGSTGTPEIPEDDGIAGTSWQNENGMVVTFAADGTGDFSVAGEVLMVFTYVDNGSTVTLTAEGDDTEATYDDTTLTIVDVEYTKI